MGIHKRNEQFYNFLSEKTNWHSYVKVQYFTDIREFITVMAVAKELLLKEDDTEYLVLASGEEIGLDSIVRVDDTVAPQYKDIMDFTCDC